MNVIVNKLKLKKLEQLDMTLVPHVCVVPQVWVLEAVKPSSSFSYKCVWIFFTGFSA